MDHKEHLKNIFDSIRHIESLHDERRKNEVMRHLNMLAPRDGAMHMEGLPNLPPRLHRPDYAQTSGLIGKDVREVEFYVACEKGQLEQVKSFVQDGPSQIVLPYGPNQAELEQSLSKAVFQFGLELAFFAVQPDIVRYLLEKGAVLHDGVFLRSWRGLNGRNVCLFNGLRPDPLPVVQVFLDFGWHPNQLWNGLHSLEGGYYCIIFEVLDNIPLLALLLSHGADPCLSRHDVGICSKEQVDRRSTRALDNAVHRGGIEEISLLVKHSADPTRSQPLHSIAAWRGTQRPFHTSFSARRRVAEYLISSKIASINETKCIRFIDFIASRGRYESITPFVYACAAQDWEFAEWLLEQGAGPDLADGRTFKPLMYSMPNCGPSDPAVVRELANRVRERQKTSSDTSM